MDSSLAGSLSSVLRLVVGRGVLVLSEKPKPLDSFGLLGGAEVLVGGGIFFSSFCPSSSTRRSLAGRKGLSSASIDAAGAALDVGADACEVV